MRKSFSEHHEEVRKAMIGELAAVSGVELGLEDFTSTRFGQDKRLEEVARMLCSSTIPVIRTIERPEARYVHMKYICVASEPHPVRQRARSS